MLIDKLIDKSDDSLVMELEQNVERSKKFLAAEDTPGLNYTLSDFHQILHSAARTDCIGKILNGMVDLGTAQSSYSHEICRNSAPACFRP